MLGTFSSIIRLALREWVVPRHVWLAAGASGALIPVIDTHNAGVCVLVPLAMSAGAISGFATPIAAWRWPLAVLLGVAATSAALSSPGYLDRGDLSAMLVLLLSATYVGATIRRLSARRAIRSAVVAALCTFGPITAASTQATAPRLAAVVDSMVLAAVTRTSAPGAPVAVRWRGTTLVDRGYGVAERTTGIPVSAATVFAIGSITKSFTAAAVLTQVAAGRLQLDTPVARFFPGRSLDPRITVRHLLNHTSGLKPYESLIPRVSEFARTAVASDTILSFIAGKPLDFEPGAQWMYSNTGYHLLGLVLQQVTGRPFFEHIESQLAALGLHATRACDLRAATHVASGYEVEREGLEASTQPNVSFSFAAGGLCSTAADLVRWFEQLPRSLPAPYGATLIAPTQLADGKRHPYGFGVATGDLAGHSWYGHGGSLPGFDAFVAQYPNDSLTIAIVANLRPFDSEGLQKRVVRRLLDIPDAVLLDLPLSAEQRKRYLGVYTVSGRSLRIEESGQRLKLSGPGDFTLLNQGHETFVAQADTDLQVTFVLDGNTVTGMSFIAPGRRFELRKVP